MEINPQNTNKLVLGGAVILIIVLIFVGVAWYRGSQSTTLSDVNNSDNGAVANNDQPLPQNGNVANTSNVNSPVNSNVPANNGNSNLNSNTGGSASAYKDGTYTTTASYSSPGGTEKITVSLTLKDDKVVASNVTTTPADHDSRYYQQQFIDNYKSVVIGKDISSLQLGRIAGSSLTPIGFNTAVKQIKAQAKA